MMQFQQFIQMLQPVQDWWHHLADRERQLLSVAGTAFLIACFYWMVWHPLSVAEESAEVQLIKQRNMLNDVKSTASKIASLRGSGESYHSKNLSSTVSRSSLDYGMQITRMQPRGKRVQVWLEDTSFNQLLEWLAFLVEKHHISIDLLDISRTDVKGVVSVKRLQLSK